jgi:hypothetical protein
MFAAFRILESLPSINEELRVTVGLGESLSVRLSLDKGSAIYDENPGLITGDFLNAFLKHEKTISLVHAVTITERIHRQIDESLKSRFLECEHFEEIGCKVFRAGQGGQIESVGPLVAANVPSLEATSVRNLLELESSLRRSLPRIDREPDYGLRHLSGSSMFSF